MDLLLGRFQLILRKYAMNTVIYIFDTMFVGVLIILWFVYLFVLFWFFFLFWKNKSIYPKNVCFFLFSIFYLGFIKLSIESHCNLVQKYQTNLTKERINLSFMNALMVWKVNFAINVITKRFFKRNEKSQKASKHRESVITAFV